MTTPSNASVPASFGSCSISFIASDGTAAKVLQEPTPAAGGSATAPTYFGGASLLDLLGVSTDPVAKDAILWACKVMTTVGAATGAVVTTNASIPRASGSFIADGWEPGHLVMMFAPASGARQAVEGLLGVVSAVSAGALTLNGTSFGVATVDADTRICRVVPVLRTTVAIGAGMTTPAANLLASDNYNSNYTSERKLDSTELLAVSMVSAVSALPAYVAFNGQVARY